MSTYVACVVSVDELLPARPAILLARELAEADFVRFPAAILVGGPAPQDFHPPDGLFRDQAGYRTVYRTPGLYYFREIASLGGDRKFADIAPGVDLATLTNWCRSPLGHDADLLDSYRGYAKKSFLSAIDQLQPDGTTLIQFNSLNFKNPDVASLLKRQDASVPEVCLGSSNKVLEYAYSDAHDARQVRRLTEFLQLWGNNGPASVEGSRFYQLIEKHLGAKLSFAVGFS